MIACKVLVDVNKCSFLIRSGKSSLITAILGLEDLLEGRILIDGVSTSTLSLDVLRSIICLIPQEPTLFHGSVRVNIDPKNEFSDGQIWDALSAVQLTSVIERMSEQLQTVVTESGSTFSAGQRQVSLNALETMFEEILLCGSLVA